MLAGALADEFELEDEPWYDPRDLQQDLQLAAELGKTLLDRNTELEDSLQQMCTANQEQLQEIEYLSKQVDLLRQMNEQHAKVYEQLDITARDLEETNQRLVADSKASQQRVLSLTETIECLQANIDELQSQVDELKSSGQGQGGQGTSDQKPAPSFSCLKELYDLRQHFVYDHVFAEKITSLHGGDSPDAAEQVRLQKAVAALRAQLRLERQQRAALEGERAQVLAESGELARQLRAAGACEARVRELEAEVAELRQALRARPPHAAGAEDLAPDAPFGPFRGPGPSLLDEVLLAAPDAARRPLKRSSSETALSSRAGGDVTTGHEDTCARRAEAVQPRGVSLLQELDTQYSALKAKYEELLRRCQRQDGALSPSLSHKAVQTAGAGAGATAGPEPAGSPGSTPPPEYKALFQELFSCLRKSQQDIEAQRARGRPGLQPPA